MEKTVDDINYDIQELEIKVEGYMYTNTYPNRIESLEKKMDGLRTERQSTLTNMDRNELESMLYEYMIDDTYYDEEPNSDECWAEIEELDMVDIVSRLYNWMEEEISGNVSKNQNLNQ